jgi:hypothetical protein
MSGKRQKISYEIKPGRRVFKSLYLRIMLWFLGRAVQAAARVDRDVRQEFSRLPEGFTVCLGVLPHGPYMVVGKDQDGTVKYLGGNPQKHQPLDLNMQIKHLEAAFMLFSFQESTCIAQARDRLIVAGDVQAACIFVRILNLVEIYLLPKFLAKLAVKRYRSPHAKYINRALIYVRTIFGY